MKMRTFTDEQIIQILHEAETGEQTIGSGCRADGIAENTFYKWRKSHGGVDVAAIKRLRELEQENTRLKRIFAERDLEVDGVPFGPRRSWQNNDRRAAATRDGTAAAR